MNRDRRFKIIGFDNWTGGAHLFARLLPSFRELGLDMILIHLGSWGNDPGRPESETFGGLEVRDISYYGSMGFEEILDREGPDAVLFMSTDTFAHRAFNRYCRSRGIPTVHLYHGIVRVQAVDDAMPYRVNPASQLRFAASKVGKALRHVWPAYAASLWRTGARPDEWGRFAADILRLGFGRYVKRSAADARTDRCCVYVPADVAHAVGKYGFPPDLVIPVGNPDLVQFGIAPSMIGGHLNGAAPSPSASDVMYIDTGLFLTGFVFASEREFLNHLIETRDSLAQQRKRLVLKPHPAMLRAGFGDALRGSGIEVCSNEEFVERLRQCCAAITETSSLGIVPALLGLPLFLAGYGRLRDQRYGEVLTSYPRARRLTEIEAFTRLLGDEQRELDADRTRKWIVENAGPLPAERMPHRVAQVIVDAIRTRPEVQR